MKGSNRLICVLNFLNFLLSVPILVVGIWQSTGANNTECLILLQWPLIVIGISMMVTSLVGLVGAGYRNSFLVRLYLVVMLIILVVLVGFIVFAYAVTAKGSGRETQNRAYLEYYLQDYKGWLKKRVESDGYWRKIRSCLRDSRVCGKIGRTVNGVPETADIFYLRNLSPIQSGCCKPPRECGYVYENGTVWRPVEGVVVGSNPDCTRWSNDQHLLCYDCDSCKAGVLASLKKSWRKVSVINIPVSATLVVVYIISYAAYRNNHRRINNCEPCGQTRMIKLQP